jgi:hypothetical protein
MQAREGEVMPSADALSSKPRREAFQDESAEVMTISFDLPRSKDARRPARRRIKL